MKLGILIGTCALSMIAFTEGRAQSDPGDWAPAFSGPGQKIEWLEYDMSRADGRLTVKMAGIAAEYYYDWPVTDMAAIARANGFYSTLLTAKTAGIGIHIRHTILATNNTRIQVVRLNE
jgi:hypothetical protein